MKRRGAGKTLPIVVSSALHRSAYNIGVHHVPPIPRLALSLSPRPLTTRPFAVRSTSRSRAPARDPRPESLAGRPSVRTPRWVIASVSSVVQLLLKLQIQRPSEIFCFGSSERSQVVGKKSNRGVVG